MANEALIVVLLAAAVCISVDGFELRVNSTTTVKDGKEKVVAVSNVTIAVSGYNHTRDSAMLNDFVQNQFNKLQKTPELFAERDDAFARRRPPPPHPPGDLVLSYTLDVRTKFDIGPDPARTLEISLRNEVFTRKKTDPEALFALRVPTF